jgi:hypothetical protein
MTIKEQVFGFFIVWLSSEFHGAGNGVTMERGKRNG